MKKTSIYEREALLTKIKECRDRGLNQVLTAAIVGKSKSCVATYCSRYGITGWPQGAAARDQTGNKNPAFKNGLSRATVNRLSKQVLLLDGRDLFKCERCSNRSNIQYPRHHKDRNRANNTPENLEVLCHSCHNKEHMPEQVRAATGIFVKRS